MKKHNNEQAAAPSPLNVDDINGEPDKIKALLKENEQLKEQVRVLREAAKNFMYNWDALGNANDYSHTAAKMHEALSQTETKVN